jgi:hypothetical protein
LDKKRASDLGETCRIVEVFCSTASVQKSKKRHKKRPSDATQHRSTRASIQTKCAVFFVAVVHVQLCASNFHQKMM